MRFARAAVIALATISFAAVSSATDYTVTNANDSGPGSLRDAITQANASSGNDIVRFSIGSGRVVLKPATPYPTTVGQIDIMGSSQPGFLSNPLIEIDASALSAPAFHITAGSSLGYVAISGDHAAAIEAGDGAIIGGCFIGTDAAGTTAIPNATGILVTGAGARLILNLVSGNAVGIEVTSAGIGTAIYENQIGLSAAGTAAIPNGVGVDVTGDGSATGLAIGLPGISNAIAGNSGPAIRVTSFNGVTITDNYIGTADYTGRAMGNGSGIELNGNNATISGNVIENNSGAAIWIGGGSGNSISKNAIAKNGFGIDLGDTRDGHTANDGLDGDSGPNGLQNYPVISMAVANLTSPTPTTTITGNLSSAANSSYSIEFFANTNCAGGDYTTADAYLTTLNVTTDSSGNAPFSYTGTFVPIGGGIAATATDSQNNTSEISNCSVVTTHGAFQLPAIPPSVLETAGSLTVPVTRVGGSAGTATVDYATSTPVPVPGFNNATPGADYAATSGTLTFADGEVSKTITIPIFDDKLYENTEIFDLALSNPTGGASLDSISTNRVYILDDEPMSKISIANTSVIEGNSGITYAHFPVTVSPPAGFPVTVTFVVSGGSATAGEDFQAMAGSITFAPGESLKTIDVPVFGDTKYELDEVFGVSLLSATPADNVAFTNFGALCTIVNDDIGKVSCTPSVSVLEGAAGTTTNVEITCTPDSPFAGGVYYVTVDGTAKAAKPDFMYSSGSVVFNPGSGPAKFVVPIIGNNIIEPDKQFTIKLTADPAPPWNFIVEPAAITVTILNDDTPGVVTCHDLGAIEGNSGLNNAAVYCSSPSPITGTIDYATHDGTAVAPSDYYAVSGTMTFNDETTKSFFVPIVGDTIVEPDEHFTISFVAHPGDPLAPFSLAQDSITMTIPNDDQPPPAQVLLLSPARILAMAGETVQVHASMDPPSDTETPLTIIVQDLSVVDVPPSAVIAPGQPAVIPFVAKKPGSTTVTVSAATGNYVAVLLVDVTQGPPVLTSIEPSSGIVPGGVNVSLHGMNLSAGCIVSFGSIQATGATFNSTTAATVVAPPHGAGTVDVTLACGSSTTTLPQAFTYIPVRGRAARH